MYQCAENVLYRLIILHTPINYAYTNKIVLRNNIIQLDLAYHKPQDCYVTLKSKYALAIYGDKSTVYLMTSNLAKRTIINKAT